MPVIILGGITIVLPISNTNFQLQKHHPEIIISIGGQASQQKIILRIVNEPASHRNYTQ